MPAGVLMGAGECYLPWPVERHPCCAPASIIPVTEPTLSCRNAYGTGSLEGWLRRDIPVGTPEEAPE